MVGEYAVTPRRHFCGSIDMYVFACRTDQTRPDRTRQTDGRGTATAIETCSWHQAAAIDCLCPKNCTGAAHRSAGGPNSALQRRVSASPPPSVSCRYASLPHSGVVRALLRSMNFFLLAVFPRRLYARATAVWSGLMRARAASTIQLALYRLNRNRSLVRSFVALCRGRRGGLASCRWRCGALHPRQQQQQHHRHLSIDFLVLVHNLWSVLLALRRRNDVMYVRVF